MSAITTDTLDDLKRRWIDRGRSLSHYDAMADAFAAVAPDLIDLARDALAKRVSLDRGREERRLSAQRQAEQERDALAKQVAELREERDDLITRLDDETSLRGRVYAAEREAETFKKLNERQREQIEQLRETHIARRALERTGAK